MARFSLHAVAPDRPGIVAAVTQALADLGCNLEDSRMARLHGNFSIVLVLEAPGVTNGTAVEEVLAPLLEPLALQLFVRPLAEEPAVPGPPGERVLVVAKGADHTGTIARLARAVVAAGGNVVDLVGHVAPEDLEAPSHLQVTVDLPPGATSGLRAALDVLAAELHLRCEVRALGHDGAALHGG